MQKMESNSISAIVTDPPYGLKFMGKEWDHGIPNIPFWREALRITRPGAFLLSFGGTRTFHRLTCAIEDAGWKIRDCLMWLYGSGFPKSHNHFGLEGYGTALKPAWEPIIMAMKPCDDTFAQNAEKWEQAGINIDGCRIAIDQDDDIYGKNPHTQHIDKSSYSGGLGISNSNVLKGRWPANLILDEEAGAMLDEQSGILKSGKLNPISTPKSNDIYGKYVYANINKFESNSGGASRFFYCAKASASERNAGCEELLDKIGGGMNATVHGDTRTGHISIQKNNHPTVKPLKLMEYLIKLVMPPKDGVLLDPFAGSGTTILAAKNLGYTAIGIEKDEEYCEIARKRIES